MRNTLSLQDLFHDRIFRIPDYQRGYAWESKQVGEFLDDLALLDSSRHHYTGTIVLCRRADAEELEDNEGTRYVEVDLVDGQQRLTTTVLLLSEISKALNEYPGSRSLAQGIKKRYVEISDMDGQSLHKLSLNGDTDRFFKEHVLPKAPKDFAGPSVVAGQRLLDARDQIACYLSEAGIDPSDRQVWLRELQRKVTDRLRFNLYEVESEAEVGVIFEVMNDRGKQLTHFEKVKNYLLYAADALHVGRANRHVLAKAVNDAWAHILRELMAAQLASPANEDQLLRAHWLMEYDPQSRRWEGSKSVRRRFDLRKNPHAQILEELHTYVRGLRNSCISYCDALNPGRDSAFNLFPSPARRDVKLWNAKFERIEVTATFLPLLMAVRKRWPKEPDRYLEVLRLCEAMAFRVYRVGRYYSSYRQPAMFNLAYKVAGGVDIDVALEIKRQFGSRESRHIFDEFTNPASPQSWYGRRGIRYFLYEYESQLSAGRGGKPKVGWDELGGSDSIEHILPQNMGDESYWHERFGSEAHGQYKHDIGNLTLTKGNASLSNKPFPDKRGTKDTNGYCYENSLLLVERTIAANWDDWTVDTIDERRASLLEWAKKRWHVDFSDVGYDSYDPDDDSGDEANGS